MKSMLILVLIYKDRIKRRFEWKENLMSCLIVYNSLILIINYYKSILMKFGLIEYKY